LEEQRVALAGVRQGQAPELVVMRFVERLARQHELLKRLRGASDKPNISALAREFNVARKTIHRDLHDLIQRGQLDAAVYPEWKATDAPE